MRTCIIALESLSHLHVDYFCHEIETLKEQRLCRSHSTQVLLGMGHIASIALMPSKSNKKRFTKQQQLKLVMNNEILIFQLGIEPDKVKNSDSFTFLPLTLSPVSGRLCSSCLHHYLFEMNG